MLRSRKDFFSPLQRQLLRAFHPKLPPNLSMYAPNYLLTSRRFTRGHSDEAVFYRPRRGRQACPSIFDFSRRQRCAFWPVHAVLVQMLRAHDGAAKVRAFFRPRCSPVFFLHPNCARYFSLAAATALLSGSLQTAASSCFDIK